MKPILRSLIALSALAISSCSFGWIDTGHMVIAAMAEDRLNDKAYKECNRLLAIGGTDQTKGFVAASCWADDTKTKENGLWHYIDIPYRIDGKPTTTKPDEHNVVWAINNFRDILKDKTKPDAERADALRYLIHFVEDIHQPLHAITMESDEHPDGDRGGNDFKIKTGDLFTSMQNPPTNLHFLWDMGCGLFMPGFVQRPLNQEALARLHIAGQNLASQYQPSLFKDQLKDMDPAHWAEESNKTAQNVCYKVLIGGEIDLGYQQIGKNIAGMRAALAGYRLAALLNQLLG